MVKIKKILTNLHQEKSLIRHLLIENNKNFSVDYAVVDIKKELMIETVSDEELLYQTYLKLISLKDKLDTYKNSVDSLEFSKSLIRLLKIFQENEVELDKYPGNRDIYLLLNSLNELPTYEKMLLSKLNDYNYENEVYNYQTNNLIEKRIVDKSSPLNITTPDSSIILMRALNKAVEVEWVAQDIIVRNLNPNQIRISYPTEMENLVRSILVRYGLGEYQTYNNDVKLFLKVVNNYYQNGITDDFLFGILSTIIKNGSSLIELIKLTKIPFSELKKTLDFNLDSDYSDLLDKSEIARIELIDFIDKLDSLTFNSYQKYVKTIYQLSVEYFSDSPETLLLVRNQFKKINNDYSDSYYVIVDYLLDKVKRRFTSLISLNSKQTFLVKDYHYSLGNKDGNFLENYLYNDLIDEYQAQNLGLIDVKERQANAITRARNSFKSNKETIILYSWIDYKGKPIDAPLELFEHLNVDPNIGINAEIKTGSYRAPINDYQRKIDVKQLIIKDGNLHASISSIEKYTKCPYSYFLQKALKLYSKNPLGIGPMHLGNIMHKTLEFYYRNPSIDISQYLQEAFKNKDLYRYHNNDYKLITKYLEKQLINSIQAHSLIETDGLFKSVEYESEFDNIIINTPYFNYVFRGIIDRVDEYQDYFVVKDYKTGITSFSGKKFVNGLMLQLPTYLLAYKNKTKKNPVGAYYLVLSNGTISYQKYDYKVSTGLELFNEEIRIKKAYRYNGLTTSDDPIVILSLIPNIIGIKGISKQKNLIIDGVNNYDLERTLKIIYTKIAKSISEGDFSIRPVEGGCSYCDFKSICSFKGKFWKPQLPNSPKTTSRMKFGKLIELFNSINGGRNGV